MAAHPDALKQRFVLDTSVFITEENRREGEDLEAAVSRLLDGVAAARLELGISCYMPPSIHAELTTMLEDRVSEETIDKLNTWVIRKHPDRYGVSVPAEVVYEFVDEMRERVDRGLRVSEDAVREAGELGDEPLDDHDHKTTTDEVVANLRERYRRALRRGVVDSREDFDLLVLARELDAGVVSEDQGVREWTEDFGLRYMRGREFPALLAEYLAAADAEYGDGESGG